MFRDGPAHEFTSHSRLAETRPACQGNSGPPVRIKHITSSNLTCKQKLQAWTHSAAALHVLLLSGPPPQGEQDKLWSYCVCMKAHSTAEERRPSNCCVTAVTDMLFVAFITLFTYECVLTLCERMENSEICSGSDSLTNDTCTELNVCLCR